MNELRLTFLLLLFAPLAGAAHFEQRNEVSYLRGKYNTALFYRHNETFRNGAAIHFAHGIQHDYLQLTPLSEAARVDAKANREYMDFLLNHRARTEPSMEYYGPYVARGAWKLYRAIDWTHMHHEQTYDVMAERSIPWSEKKEWTDRTVRYYLEKNRDVARSCAPLDVTMRRAGTMMKPYFTYFRNKYPKSNNFFFAAHWWHPVIYEAQMLGGNGPGQDMMVRQTDQVMYNQVLKDRPQRMLLSREVMPRYSRLSPESANIFDNLHMLHGIAYDILAYEGWTMDEKRAEIYRVVEAMSYQPGDEKLARKFKTPYPEMDPRRYEEWMKGFDGEMNRIMMEMQEEMMPLMMPEGKTMSEDRHKQMMEAFRKKLTPGMQEGEIEGSWHDAMMQMMPDMKMDPEGMKPGKPARKMIEAMLEGWRKKYGDMPDIEPWPMADEPKPAMQTAQH
ncbi:MAG TPA: hypothetical protein VEC99_05930 [Clostridia bacterium]|nr:hypothetical protein [Clostridia bacterium]